MAYKKGLVIEISLYWVLNIAVTVWLVMNLLSEPRNVEFLPLVAVSYLALIAATIYWLIAAGSADGKFYRNRIKGDLCLILAGLVIALVILFSTMRPGEEAYTIYLASITTLFLGFLSAFHWSRLRTIKDTT